MRTRHAVLACSAAAALLLAGCGSKPTAASQAGGTIPAGTAPASTVTEPSTTLPPTTAPPTTTAVATVGGTYTVTYDGATSNVKLVSVTDPASGKTQFDKSRTGGRLVAARFQISAVSGDVTGNINISAHVVGGDGQSYTVALSDVVGCTNFNAGSYDVPAGQTSVGCAVFDMPPGVTVAEVDYSPAFLAAKAARWTVTGATK